MAVEVTRPVEPEADAAVAARRAAQRADTAALQAHFRHELNVAYGDDPRQVLDIYYPTELTTAAPVLVFIHGGGFRNGAPGLVGYHGRPYLERGSIFVALGYRLRPAVRFPETSADIERGLGWLVAHLAERGGDPGRIYLAGHSAGAMLAAAASLRSWPAGVDLPDDLIKGAVLISGMYDLRQHADDAVDRASPRYVVRLAEAIDRLPAQVILVGGDQDLPRVLPDAADLRAAIQARGGSVELFVEPNADHFAANRSFMTRDGIVARAVIQMMQR